MRNTLAVSNYAQNSTRAANLLSSPSAGEETKRATCIHIAPQPADRPHAPGPTRGAPALTISKTGFFRFSTNNSPLLAKGGSRGLSAKNLGLRVRAPQARNAKAAALDLS